MRSHPSSSPLGGRVLASGVMALAMLATVPANAAARAAEPTTSARATRSAVPPRARRDEGELPFVYFHTDRTMTISGSDRDVSRAQRYRRSGEPMLWFRRDGREYVVRDPRVLREVDALWAPVSRIGEEEGRIGAQQAALGAQQAEVGARQGRISAQQGAIGARLGLLAAQEARGVSVAERREMEQERAALERDMRRLDREMEALDQGAREDDSPTRELREEMAVLGRQMELLGGRMDAASRRANAEMRTLVDRAVARGAAQAVR